jgi:pentatricopeptide repeat protein
LELDFAINLLSSLYTHLVVNLKKSWRTAEQIHLSGLSRFTALFRSMSAEITITFCKMRFAALAITVVLMRLESGAAFLSTPVRNPGRQQCPQTALFSATAQDVEKAINVVEVDEELSIEEYTERILRGEYEDDDAGNILPILQSWCKRESVEGAEMTQKILFEMENQVDSGILPKRSLRANHYAIAVNAWGKSGHEESVKMAESIFRRMEERGVEPNRIVYNCLMNAYALQSDPHRVSEILDQMEQVVPEEILPTDYNVLMAAYARQGNAIAVENLVKQMVDRYNQGQSKFLPDLVSYNIILDAWAKSDSENSGSRAEMILDAIEATEGVTPDERSYVTAMMALIRSGEEGIVSRVEAIWERAKANGVGHDPYVLVTVLDSYAVGDAGNAADKVDNIFKLAEEIDLTQHERTVICNAALKVFRESQDEGAFASAEQLFEKMLSDGTVDIVSYSTMIAIYANETPGQSTQRKAEELLEKMKDSGLSCNTAIMNGLINLWIRQGDMGKATSLLDEMEQAYKEGNHDLAPNVVSYTAIMNGWAKSKGSASSRMTDETFQRMEAMVKSGNESAEPNFITYVTLIEGMSKSGQPEAAERAERIVRDMYSKSKNGYSDVKPNVQLISAVINCWGKSGSANAGEHAESLLNWMIEIYEEENDKDLEPNEFAFASGKNAIDCAS